MNKIQMQCTIQFKKTYLHSMQYNDLSSIHTCSTFEFMLEAIKMKTQLIKKLRYSGLGN